MNKSQLKSGEKYLGLKDAFFIYDYRPISISSKILAEVAGFLSSGFAKFRISGNVINFLSLTSVLLGVYIMILAGVRGLIVGIVLYFFSCCLNIVAGQTALKMKSLSYFDLLWDKFSRNLAVTILRFALLWMVYIKFSFNTLFWIGFLCLLLTPFYFFLHDRYSTFARWINEEKGKNLNPSAGIEKFYKNIFWVEDAGHAALILALIWFGSAIGVYFLINILLQISTIIHYFQLAYVNMRVSNYEFSAGRV